MKYIKTSRAYFNLKMKGKINLFILTLSSLLFLPKIISAEEERRLEIVYPEIPGKSNLTHVSVELPVYVEYVFHFSIIIIGFVIFAALIYNGIKYLTSLGNPSKIIDAKQGMLAAILGSLVLLGAVLIFGTINPQLVKLEQPKAEKTKAYITPGVYICTKEISANEIINGYTSGNPEKREEAAIKMREEMGEAKDNTCFLASNSSIFKNFSLKENGDWTIFTVPTEKYNKENEEYEWVYEYGAILHETDNYRGKCEIFPSPSGGGKERNIYTQIKEPTNPSLDFTAKSITVFRNISYEPADDMAGVILYEKKNFNKIIDEDEDKNDIENTDYLTESAYVPASKSGAADSSSVSCEFRPGPGADALYVSPSEFKSIFPKGAESIRFEPSRSFLAVLDGENENICEVRSLNDTDLSNDHIGQCGIGCRILGGKVVHCKSCIKSLYIIKGEVL
jgi:hypothetical protein